MAGPTRWTLLLLAVALAGCPAARVPTTTHPKASAAPPTIASTPGPTATPTPEPLASTPAPTLPTPTPGPLVLPTPGLAATLTGKVKAPASLVSDHGGGIIANNGGGYRLLAVDQAPLQGVTVTLLDAQGKPIPGIPPATTQADGTYAFTATLPNQPLIARVDLGAKGALQALALTSQADIELVSTLTTGYILNQYVATQPDPLKTLAKLPASAEAATRTAAASALTAVPDALTTAKVVAAVDSLRKANKAFDDQMEAVKKILIAAGVSNLGVGLPATDVYMRRFFASDVAADGTLYSFDADDGYIWRIGPDGKLVPVAGGADKADDKSTDRTGLKGEQMALEFVWSLQLDATDRPVICEDKHGVWRRETDGSITQLHTQAALTAAFGASGVTRGVHFREDGTLVVTKDGAVWALPPGGAKQRLADATGALTRFGLVELPGAQRWLGSDFYSLTEMTAAAAPKVLMPETDPRLRVNPGSGVPFTTPMDHRGNFFYIAADQQIHRLRPDGTDTALAPATTLGKGLAWMLEGRDGKTYAADSDQSNYGSSLVRRFDGATTTIIAGLDGLPKGLTSDGRLPLLYPKGLEVGPDGTLWIADAGVLMEIPPGGTAKVIGAKATYIPEAFTTVDFTGVRRLASGQLYARALGKSTEFILSQSADGLWHSVMSKARGYANDWNIAFHAWDVAPDGTVMTSWITPSSGGFINDVAILRQRPGETLPTVLVPVSEGLGDIGKIAFTPDGTPWIWATKGISGKPVRYTVASDGKLTPIPDGTILGEAKDLQGRVYEGDASTFTGGNFGNRHIRRQATGGTVDVVAGKGAPLLGGAGIDDSIGWAEDLRFDAAGNLYVRDVLRRQVRRIPKDRL
ncbi:MAG: hypothetical protein JWM80_5908 [Cyanobacteria bacterium RYN_339]|nr:hypothetical protein [Cyanobacteria bacterium RYN_339]